MRLGVVAALSLLTACATPAPSARDAAADELGRMIAEVDQLAVEADATTVRCRESGPSWGAFATSLKCEADAYRSMATRHPGAENVAIHLNYLNYVYAQVVAFLDGRTTEAGVAAAVRYATDLQASQLIAANARLETQVNNLIANARAIDAGDRARAAALLRQSARMLAPQ